MGNELVSCQEGTPDWSLNVDEELLEVDVKVLAEFKKESGKSLGYFKPKSSYLCEHTRVSELIGEPTHLK